MVPLAPLLVATLELPERMRLHGDDNLFRKSGRTVHGAGGFRDPIRSRGQQTGGTDGVMQMGPPGGR